MKTITCKQIRRREKVSRFIYTLIAAGFVMMAIGASAFVAGKILLP